MWAFRQSLLAVAFVQHHPFFPRDSLRKGIHIGQLCCCALDWGFERPCLIAQSHNPTLSCNFKALPKRTRAVSQIDHLGGLDSLHKLVRYLVPRHFTVRAFSIGSLTRGKECHSTHSVPEESDTDFMMPTMSLTRSGDDSALEATG